MQYPRMKCFSVYPPSSQLRDDSFFAPEDETEAEDSDFSEDELEGASPAAAGEAAAHHEAGPAGAG